MSQPNSMIGKFFYRIWKTIDVAGRLMIGLIALTIFILFVRSCTSGPDLPRVDDGAALILAPKGVIVEQETYLDPIERAMQEAQGIAPNETSIYDLLDAIEYAKNDDRISVMVINVNSLQGVYAGISKYQDLREAINEFKESGKKVIAVGDYYMQGQFYLASAADEVYMNPFGMLMFEGLGGNNTYFKSALDNLGVNVHVFRVGTFKSAVEPFIRDDMSEAAKEANREWMGDLWTHMKQDLAASRDMSVEEFDDFVENYLVKFEAVNGDSGELAVQEGFIDKLMTRGEFRQYMIDMVGLNEKKDSYKAIGHKNYLKAVRPLVELPSNKDTVAVIVAKGEIVDGSRKEGVIGGDSTARLIQKARLDDKVKAIVLRVDSPGGSAFASEVIRSELERAQNEGKVVVASMGGVAASGGYWISATSDEIWAHPTTITGSIGIFGMVPTFEEPLNKLGVHRDGVGTTKWTLAFDPMDGISPEFAQLIQRSIERGYDRFLSLVAEGRNMTKEEVDQIAQGRVWSGEDAHRLGLVDQLGDLEDAIESAAKLANIGDDYAVKFIKRELSAEEVFIRNLLENAKAEGKLDAVIAQLNNGETDIIGHVLGRAQKIVNIFNNFNDPNHVYAHCMCVGE
ncbi:signal peptide peptidase SppA [Kangiella aquimarina]|uniref:Signal peptide peptidase SppA n=1 Tax=Kangiella aquimarina TaxID=261965 RepID=A0ABZ0X1U6_9GAMM|nr:signal peptide peptidase SppA [Kangiella aquimarina]WQG84359.1 signal peptide peptidase SppA [Kangiella aquimarina]